jgi:hypothetical protein
VNGKLTLMSELEVNNLEVIGNTSLNDLQVSGDTGLTNLKVSGDMELTNLDVTGTTNINNLDMFGFLNVNNTTITTTELSCLNGVTSEIQTQLNSKVGSANPIFSGTVILPTTESKGYTYFGNDGATQPTYALSSYFGAIGANMTGGNGDMDFINTGYDSASLTLSAFDWYRLTSTTTKELLMRLYHSGGLLISGLLNAVGGITTTTLTATGLSTLADVNVNGNLTVSGNITSSSSSNMEILYYQLKGNAANVVETMTLVHNTTATLNYSVFPSLYYGFTGSSGTYDALQTSSALNNIVIGARTDSSFTWSVNKSTGDNVNVFVVFLVIYNASSSDYYTSYSS